jgi:hypothetical protein
MSIVPPVNSARVEKVRQVIYQVQHKVSPLNTLSGVGWLAIYINRLAFVGVIAV